VDDGRVSGLSSTLLQLCVYIILYDTDSTTRSDSECNVQSRSLVLRNINGCQVEHSCVRVSGLEWITRSFWTI